MTAGHARAAAAAETAGAGGAASAGRERLLVELVDQAGRAIGACSVAEAHAAPARRHRAFSLLLYDHLGRVLVQQRSAAKTRFASRWSNTCCGHPAPGQGTAAAAAARLSAEIGLTGQHTTPLTEIGVLRYRAADTRSGHVECEWDHVLVGTVTGGTPDPDDAEVFACRWVYPGWLRAEVAARPGSYTPWLPGVLDIAARSRKEGL